MSVALGTRLNLQTRQSNPHIDHKLLLQGGGENHFKYATRGGYYASTNPTQGGSLILGNDNNTYTPNLEKENKGGSMSGGNDDDKADKIEQDILKVVHKVLSKKTNHIKLNKGVEPEEYGKMLGGSYIKSVYRKHIYPSLNNGEQYTYNMGTAKGRKEHEDDYKLGVVDKMIINGLKWGWGKLKTHIEKKKKEKRGGSFEITDKGADELLPDEEGGKFGNGKAKAKAFFGGVWKGIKMGAKILPTIAPFIL
jgi:hypothetical protein